MEVLLSSLPLSGHFLSLVIELGSIKSAFEATLTKIEELNLHQTSLVQISMYGSSILSKQLIKVCNIKVKNVQNQFIYQTVTLIIRGNQQSVNWMRKIDY